MSSRTPERKAINQHLWTHHQTKGTGELLDRLVQHDALHAASNDYPYAGSPKHRHEAPAMLGEIGEVIVYEGEGT